MLPTFFLDSTLLVFICNRIVNHFTWEEFCFLRYPSGDVETA